MDCLKEDKVEFYTFPTLSEFKLTEAELRRDCKTGYRAKYIIKSRDVLQSKGDEYFTKLKQMEYKDVTKELMEYSGIGKKVADCISLMCLDTPSSIGIDTHVFQLTQKLYFKFSLQVFTITLYSITKSKHTLYNIYLKLCLIYRNL